MLATHARQVLDESCCRDTLNSVFPTRCAAHSGFLPQEDVLKCRNRRRCCSCHVRADGRKVRNRQCLPQDALRTFQRWDAGSQRVLLCNRLGSSQKGNSQAEERQRGEFSLKACRALNHKQLVAQLKEWQRLEWEGQQLSSLQAFHRQDGACSWWRGPAAFPG